VFAEVISLNGQNILIGLDFPLTTLVGIAGKRKQLLTYTQKTTRAKLE
jgi:hypothetical protein